MATQDTTRGPKVGLMSADICMSWANGQSISNSGHVEISLARGRPLANDQCDMKALDKSIV